jgi:fermentation-respiration switch protein FrsA (DUF1100 family)
MIKSVKVAIIMSGGLEPDGTLPKHVLQRCDYVLNNNTFNFVILSSSFTLNVPPKRDIDGFLISEASIGFNYMVSKGFAGELLVEQFSHDTIGSVFFCLELISKSLRASEVVFVTSDFHLERVRVIAEYLDNLCRISCKLSFIGCASDSGEDIFERSKREKKSIARFVNEYKKIKTREEFLMHIIKNHSNYNHHYCGDRSVTARLFY